MLPAPASRKFPALADVLAALIVAFLAAAVFLPGIKWGLPSSLLADQLFPKSAVPMTGKEVLALTPGFRAGKQATAADLDRNPVTPQSTTPTQLNTTDAQRAEIILRYRLYSNQPDEMLTFRALATMLPGSLKLDPHMYHYGGLWIYPVGGLIKALDFPDVITVSHDLSLYLDNPSLFADFYIVARLYTVFWMALGAVAVFTLARLMNCSRLWAVFTAALWCATPGVICFGHEAKPHIPAVSISLWCLTAAAAGRWKTSAFLAGSAASMVPSAAVATLIPITYVIFWHAPWCTCKHSIFRRDSIWRTLATIAIAGATYFVFNPYVLANSSTLLANSANVASAYSTSTPIHTVFAALWKLSEATSRLTLLAGSCAIIAILAWRKHEQMRPLAGLLLLAFPAALAATIPAAIFTPNSPADTARFFLLASSLLAIFLMLATATLMPQWWKRTLLLLLVAVPQMMHSGAYLRGYLADTNPATSTRAVAAEQINRAIREQGVTAVYVPNELAPYAAPPINLWQASILLSPPIHTTGASLPQNSAELVAPLLPGHTPMSHASRLFLVRMNASVPRDAGE